MKGKIFLTSVVAIGIASNAFAETFPSDGSMQENTTYENAATYKNMGVYEGAVTANAEYEDILYQIAAGTYLPAGSETSAECTAGNYCSGLTDAKYNESANQGLSACPSAYPNSAAGASKDTQCYTACTVANANIAHATAVDGNDYFGSGTDTCGATACDNGYHVLSGIRLIEQTPLIPVDYHEYGDGFAFVNASGESSGYSCENNGCSSDDTVLENSGITENNTWASHFDYGTVYGRASCQPSMDEGFMYIMMNLEGVMGGEMTLEDFESGLSAISGTAKAKFASNLITELKAGTKSESDLTPALWAVFGTETDANYSTTDTGQYCYCQMTGFTPTDGTKQSVAGAAWGFRSVTGSAGDCAGDCAAGCADNLRGVGARNDGFRAAVFGSLGASSAGTCEANEISITWTNADPADVSANNAGVCTYDGDIRTPVKAETKPGKTFKGWRFDKK